MLYVALVNNIKNKNIRTGMYSPYFVSIFILKLCHDKKKTGWSFELIYSKCRPNTVPLHKFLCFSEERTTGDFSGRFHGPAIPVSSCGKCKSGSGCLPVRTSSAQQGGAWNRNTHCKILHMLNHWTSGLSWYQGISITAQDLTT